MNNSYREIGEKMLEARKILIFPHVHMDGDALGSSSALCMALRKLGKEAYVLISEDVPKNLDFLACDCVTRNLEIFSAGADLAIMVDCGSRKRIEGRTDAFDRGRVKAVIDHHGAAENDTSFDYGLVEPDSAATGEMIMLLLKEMGWDIDPAQANCLFAAITTDTGNFQHANTTKRSHELTALLYDVEGFNSKPVSNLIYNRTSFEAIRLEAMVLGSIHRYQDGRVAIGRVTQKMLAETGCSMDESEGFVQSIMRIDGVDAGCLLKETPDAGVRVSLRSKTNVNVAEVAKEFGGGGHILAAGCTVHDTVDAAEKQVSASLIRQVERTRQ